LFGYERAPDRKVPGRIGRPYVKTLIKLADF
jgi:hypothetical protein